MPQPLTGIHHSAFRCRDAEQTRAFYEDLLGLPLAAVVAEDKEPGTGKLHPFVHLFFRLPDGNFFAFFDAPGSASEEKFAPVHGFDRHVAFEAADETGLKAWQDKLNAAGCPCFGPVDHGFVRSVYFQDPNGIPLEITTRVDGHDALMTHGGQDPRAVIADWSARKAAAASAA